MTTPLLVSLAPPARLALTYAPGAAQPAWLAFLALDARLAAVVRQAREPLIGQIRLAWWRERLSESAEAWPAGEPLLLLLSEWGDEQRRELVGMVDAWEALFADPPLAQATAAAAVAGRAAGVVALAEHLGLGRHITEVERIAWRWAARDFAAGMSDPAEAQTFREQVPAGAVPTLPRTMRPLLVLDALAGPSGSAALRLATAVRLGIFGR